MLALFGGLTIGLVLLITSLLVIFTRRSQPALAPASAGAPNEPGPAAWAQPSPTAHTSGSDPDARPAAPAPAQRTAVRHVGPSSAQIALGVFVGMWMFVTSAALLGLAYAALVLKSFDGIEHPGPARSAQLGW